MRTDNILYRNNSGVTTAELAGPVNPNEIETVTDGLHFTVFHRNHGLHATGNVVNISGIEPDGKPTLLTDEYSVTATTDISLSNTSTPENFSLFENIGVGVTNPGYVKIGSEVIKYTGVVGNTLTGITRGIDNTQVARHTVNNLVYKYEMNGVSLRRINKQHAFNESTSTEIITLDTYPLKVDIRTLILELIVLDLVLISCSSPRTEMVVDLTVEATYNIPFEMIIPQINTMEPTGTTISPSVRTVSGTSVSGVEPSFVDKGFEEVSLRQENFFTDPRIVASKQNEDLYLDELPGNKSFTMNMDLITDDTRISPMVDLNQASVMFITNRVNYTC